MADSHCRALSILRGMRGAMRTTHNALRRSTAILIENLIVHLMCGVGVAHWNDPKNDVNGVKGVLQEAGDEFWREADPGAAKTGPFEPPDRDSEEWMKYIDEKNELLRKRIRDIENRLRFTGLSKLELLSKEKDRKMPGNHETAADILVARKITFPALKHHLEVLKNWSAYLQDMKMNYGEHVPVDAVHGMITELESKKKVADLMELMHVHRMLLKRLRGGPPVREERVKKPCSENEDGDGRMREVLQQIQRNFSQTFLYRNITLAEIAQMSKIVDFVERYRGSVRNLKILDPVPPEKLSHLGIRSDPGPVTPEE